MRFIVWLEEANSDAVTTYLGRIEAAGYILLIHQTSMPVAHKIISSENFGAGRGSGVTGTADICSVPNIRRMQENMNKFMKGQEYSGTVHKGSDSIIIIAVPKKIVSKGTRSIDNHLIDLTMSGKLPEPYIPNNYIVGCWNANGEFFANGKFNGTGVLG